MELYHPDGNIQGYPRVWVARQKHANYRSDHDCDWGGPVDVLQWVDDCDSTKTKRPILTTATNLGSDASPQTRTDCFTSPVLFGIECYWTGLRFNGWEVATPNSGPYRDKLAAAGFVLGVIAQF